MITPTPTAAAAALFKRHFGYTPSHLVHAPAVLELLGSAAIDPAGLALSAAADKSIQVASAPRSDGKIELVFGSPPKRDLFWISEFKPNPAVPWADPVKAVLDQLRRRRVHFSGFNAAIAADLPGLLPSPDGSPAAPAPISGGLAALQVATALTVRRLHPFSLTETGSTLPPRPNPRGELPPLPAQERMFLANLCQAADRIFLGRDTTPLEPVSSLFSKAWHVLSIDLASATVERAPLIGEVFVLCSPPRRSPRCQSHTLSELRAACESARLKLGARSLRRMERKFLDANKSRLDPREYNSARYVLEENQRVVAAERALREDDHRQFGQYLLQSYESLGTLLDANTPEQDLLVEIARAHPGCLGARASGVSTLNLVSFHQVEKFMTQLSAEFQKHAGSRLDLLLCRVADGATGSN